MPLMGRNITCIHLDSEYAYHMLPIYYSYHGLTICNIIYLGNYVAIYHKGLINIMRCNANKALVSEF